MNLKKRIKTYLASILCLAVCFALFPAAALAAGTQDEPFPEKLAGELNTLGLFKGTGTGADGMPDYELDRAPTRIEALVMLARLLGKEPEALKGGRNSPFTDVADWAAPYVGYAYESGLTRGVSDTLFSPDEPVGSAEYLTFVLRALGYRDGSDGGLFTGDFLWNRPFALATCCKILPLEADTVTFLRRDAVLISYAALTATMKGTGQTLAEKLVEGGAFTQAQYDDAIDETAFSDSERINAAIHAAVLACGTPPPDEYSFPEESHEILETEENGDTLTVSAMTCYRIFEFSKFGEDRSGSVTWIPISISLRRLTDGSWETLGVRAVEQTSDLDGVFSTDTAEVIRDTDFGYMLAVCELQKENYLASGVLTFQQKTYEDALEELLSQPETSVVDRLEAPGYGTVLCRLVPAGMHGQTPTLCLVTNDSSPLGEARVTYFPLPAATIYLSAEPEQMSLSGDGGTLTYQVTHDDDFIIPNDPDDPSDDEIIYRKGTYYYSADLSTGEVTETFVPAS